MGGEPGTRHFQGGFFPKGQQWDGIPGAFHRGGTGERAYGIFRKKVAFLQRMRGRRSL